MTNTVETTTTIRSATDHTENDPRITSVPWQLTGDWLVRTVLPEFLLLAQELVPGCVDNTAIAQLRALPGYNGAVAHNNNNRIKGWTGAVGLIKDQYDSLHTLWWELTDTYQKAGGTLPHRFPNRPDLKDYEQLIRSGSRAFGRSRIGQMADATIWEVLTLLHAVAQIQEKDITAFDQMTTAIWNACRQNLLDRAEDRRTVSDEYLWVFWDAAVDTILIKQAVSAQIADNIAAIGLEVFDDAYLVDEIDTLLDVEAALKAHHTNISETKSHPRLGSSLDSWELIANALTTLGSPEALALCTEIRRLLRLANPKRALSQHNKGANAENCVPCMKNPTQINYPFICPGRDLLPLSQPS